MTYQLETTRIFLDDHRRGVVTCPYCGDTHALNMTRYPAPLGGKACHMLCGACGRLFRLIFDGRRHLRIPASLPGRLFPSAPQHESDELSQKLGYTTITVTSLSSGGIGFHTQTPVSCTVGDRYYVIFGLPDHDHSLICEDIIIRRSDPQGVGAAFCRPPGSNHALDWYIYVTSTLAPPSVDNAPFPRRLSGSREEAMTAAHDASSAWPTLRPHLPLPISEQ
jgi:uncharacterized Zn-finger protein